MVFWKQSKNQSVGYELCSNNTKHFLSVDIHLFSTWIEKIAQLYNVAMIQLPHYLQFTVLESRCQTGYFTSQTFLCKWFHRFFWLSIHSRSRKEEFLFFLSFQKRLRACYCGSKFLHLIPLWSRCKQEQRDFCKENTKTFAKITQMSVQDTCNL